MIRGPYTLGNPKTYISSGQGILTGTLPSFFGTLSYLITLIGAVAGNVFASPNASQVRRGIEMLDNEKGCVTSATVGGTNGVNIYLFPTYRTVIIVK